VAIFASGVGSASHACRVRVDWVTVYEGDSRREEDRASELAVDVLWRACGGIDLDPERDVAQYLVKLAAAGEDCRVKLTAVRRLIG